MHLFKWRRKKVPEGEEGNQPAWKPLPDFSRAVDDAPRLLVYAAETERGAAQLRFWDNFLFAD